MNLVVPEIDLEKCTACGACVEACDYDAVHMVEGWPRITSPEACSYCATCEEVCPENAISLEVEFLFNSTE